MYYAAQKVKAGKYGGDSYSVSSGTVYTSLRKEIASPILEKRGLGCCGRGCKPCVADFKM